MLMSILLLMVNKRDFENYFILFNKLTNQAIRMISHYPAYWCLFLLYLYTTFSPMNNVQNVQSLWIKTLPSKFLNKIFAKLLHNLCISHICCLYIFLEHSQLIN